MVIRIRSEVKAAAGGRWVDPQLWSTLIFLFKCVKVRKR